jgi:hypothetical protein
MSRRERPGPGHRSRAACIRGQSWARAGRPRRPPAHAPSLVRLLAAPADRAVVSTAGVASIRLTQGSPAAWTREQRRTVGRNGRCRGCRPTPATPATPGHGRTWGHASERATEDGGAGTHERRRRGGERGLVSCPVSTRCSLRERLGTPDSESPRGGDSATQQPARTLGTSQDARNLPATPASAPSTSSGQWPRRAAPTRRTPPDR